MKYIRVTGEPDPEYAPELFHVMAGSSFVTETRLFDLNISPQGRPTLLFEVDGDIDQVRDVLGRVNGLQIVEAAPITDGRFNLLVTLDPAEIPLFQDLFGALTLEGMIVAKPVIYRNKQVHARIVGSTSALQSAIGRFPSEVDLKIDSVGEFNQSRETPLSTLSDRQREAVLTAFNIGYYDHPRKATHEEIAAQLGCAPNTVSDHLQKAEKKIMAELLELEFER
jgi:DNA-binding CsgD family transcriptional regulator